MGTTLHSLRRHYLYIFYTGQEVCRERSMFGEDVHPTVDIFFFAAMLSREQEGYCAICVIEIKIDCFANPVRGA